jgi:uncharacterized protein YwqG
MPVSTDISSDQSVPFSERLETAKRALRKQMEESGLGEVTDKLEKLMRLSIRLKATAVSEADLKPGSSKLGGVPDLPEGTTWPECDGVPMALLAQFRLRDVAPYDDEGQLPKSGMLYFFYETKEQKWGFDPKDRGHWKVIYYDGELAGLRPATPPATLPKESRFRACRLTFSNEITLPSWESESVKRLNLSKDAWEKYVALPGAGCGEGQTVHRLLGHPEQIQGDMQLECQCASSGLYMGDPTGYNDPRRPALEKGASDWRLLLQIDSDENNMGAMWGDVGRVYFWIRQQDLRKNDFGNVWLVLQCY